MNRAFWGKRRALFFGAREERLSPSTRLLWKYPQGRMQKNLTQAGRAARRKRDKAKSWAAGRMILLLQVLRAQEKSLRAAQCASFNPIRAPQRAQVVALHRLHL